MNSLKLDDYTIFLEHAEKHLQQLLEKQEYSKCIVLMDDNTSKYCLPLLQPMLKDQELHLFSIPAGEINKNITSLTKIWDFISSLNADRQSLLICLGGGMVGDIGGLAAGTYMRGIDYIYFPTSLLALVDASIGGKVAIDYHDLKNQIGLFNNPKAVFIYVDFLNTLPQREMRSGYVELMKHAVIASPHLWEEIVNSDFPDLPKLTEMIEKSLRIKKQIVESDPYDQNIRKILNFGHTVGHALESCYMLKDKNILHGEAVAFGIIAETYISKEIYELPVNAVEQICTTLKPFCPSDVANVDTEQLMAFVQNDKKNLKGELRFSLIKDLGNARHDVVVEAATVREGIDWAIEMLNTETIQI